jgi:hypothetical protein
MIQLKNNKGNHIPASAFKAGGMVPHHQHLQESGNNEKI